MNDIQKVLLQLLKEIDEICKANDITYYMVGGSALGAVRHGGFIPWDDDADIVMTRDNYLKFIEVMKNTKLPENRAYEDPFIFPYTTSNIFGRYSATDTTCIFRSTAYYPLQHGIKVDVFQLLPFPDERSEREEYIRKFHIWAEHCHPIARSRHADADAYKHWINKGLREGMGKVRCKLFEDLNCDNYRDCSQYLYGYERLLFIYDKEIFQEPHYFPFEDTFLPIPTKYQAHFRQLFGDDWAIIPEEQDRASHNAYTDPHRPFSVYTSDYMRFPRKHWEKNLQDYKYLVLKFWNLKNQKDDLIMRARADCLSVKYQAFWEEQRDRLELHFARYEYLAVLDIVEDYLSDQYALVGELDGYFIDVDQRMFFIVVMSAIHSSNMKKARKLLALIPDAFINEEVSEVLSLVRSKDAITIELEETKNANQTLNEIVALLKKYPEDRDLNYWYVSLAMQKLESGALDEKMSEAICEICERRDGDGDFVKTLGDYYLVNGNISAAKDHYQRALSLTRNGMTLASIEETIAKMQLEKEE